MRTSLPARAIAKSKISGTGTWAVSEIQACQPLRSPQARFGDDRVAISTGALVSGQWETASLQNAAVTAAKNCRQYHHGCADRGRELRSRSLKSRTSVRDLARNSLRIFQLIAVLGNATSGSPLTLLSSSVTLQGNAFTAPTSCLSSTAPESCGFGWLRFDERLRRLSDRRLDVGRVGFDRSRCLWRRVPKFSRHIPTQGGSHRLKPGAGSVCFKPLKFLRQMPNRVQHGQRSSWNAAALVPDFSAGATADANTTSSWGSIRRRPRRMSSSGRLSRETGSRSLPSFDMSNWTTNKGAP